MAQERRRWRVWQRYMDPSRFVFLDENPIEQLFAKLKALLRKAAAHTKEALWSAIGELLDTFPESECQNYLRNCGYEFT